MDPLLAGSIAKVVVTFPEIAATWVVGSVALGTAHAESGLDGLPLCHEVLTKGILVHEADRDRRIDFVSDALVRAIDFMPTWRAAHEGWIDGWRRSIQDLR